MHRAISVVLCTAGILGGIGVATAAAAPNARDAAAGVRLNADLVQLPMRKQARASAVAAVRMRIVGGNRRSEAIALDRQDGTSSNFIGQDPAKWRVGVANHSKVKYTGVHSGIDVVYFGNGAQLIFSDGNNATYAYTVNGVSQVKAITRQVFGPPGTLCST